MPAHMRRSLGLARDQGAEMPTGVCDPQTACPLRACEYELADIGPGLGRILPGWCLVVLGDSLRA
jgi:hypothetical protein